MAEERTVGADRVLVVLRELGRHHEGISLEELAQAMGEPKSSVHRALAILRKRGFAAQDGRGRYAVGDELLRLAFSVQQNRPERARIEPALMQLSAMFGETAHFAVLDDAEVVYRAKIDPPDSGIRLTSVVGGRNPAHATGVGKLLLADRFRERAAFDEWAAAREFVARTAATVTGPDALWQEFEEIRRLGYAVDREESELGVECIAFPVSLAGFGQIDGAVSVSAIAVRTPLLQLVDHAERIRSALGGAAATF